MSDYVVKDQAAAKIEEGTRVERAIQKVDSWLDTSDQGQLDNSNRNFDTTESQYQGLSLNAEESNFALPPRDSTPTNDQSMASQPWHDPDELNNSAQLPIYTQAYEDVLQPTECLAEPLEEDENLNDGFPLEEDADFVDVNFDNFIQDGDWVNENIDLNTINPNLDFYQSPPQKTRKPRSQASSIAHRPRSGATVRSDATLPAAQRNNNASFGNDINTGEHYNAPESQHFIDEADENQMDFEQSYLASQNAQNANTQALFSVPPQFQEDAHAVEEPEFGTTAFEDLQKKVLDGELHQLMSGSPRNERGPSFVGNLASNVPVDAKALQIEVEEGGEPARSVSQSHRLYIFNPFDRWQGRWDGSNSMRPGQSVPRYQEERKTPVLLPHPGDDLQQFEKAGLNVEANFENTRTDHFRGLMGMSKASVPSQSTNDADLGISVDKKSSEATNVKETIAKLESQQAEKRRESGQPKPPKRVVQQPPILNYNPLSNNLRQEEEVAEKLRTLMEASGIFGSDLKLPPVKPKRQVRVAWREDYAYFMTREQFEADGDEIDRRNAELDKEEEEKEKEMEKKRNKRKAQAATKEANRKLRQKQEKAAATDLAQEKADAAMADPKVKPWDTSIETMMSLDELDAEFAAMEGDQVPVSSAGPAISHTGPKNSAVLEKNTSQGAFATAKQRDSIATGTGLSAPPKRPGRVSMASVNKSSRTQIQITFVSAAACQAGNAELEMAAKENSTIKILANFDSQADKTIVSGDAGFDLMGFIEENVEKTLIKELS